MRGAKAETGREGYNPSSAHGGGTQHMQPTETPNPQAKRQNIVHVIPLTVAEAIQPEEADGQTAGTFFVEILAESGIELQDKDVLVVSSKVATIFEGGQLKLDDIIPSRKARVLGRIFRRDPRKIQLVLEQGRVFLVVPLKRIAMIPSMRRMLEMRSSDPSAMWRGYERTNEYVFVVRNHAAYLDEAGIDHTNSPEGFVTVLPDDPCATAERIRQTVRQATGKEIAVIITDTVTCVGRLGSQDLAIGYSGIDPITRETFSRDLFGIPRSGGIDLVIDSISGMAGLVMGQTIERTPAVLVRGIDYAPQRPDEAYGMAAVAMPSCSELRIAVYTILATLRFRLGSLLALQRNAKRPTTRQA